MGVCVDRDSKCFKLNVTDFFWNGLIRVSNTRVCPTKGTPKENPWPVFRSGDARNTYQANGRMGYCQHRKGGGRGKIRGWHYSTNCGKQKQKAETETETESSEEEVEGRLGGGITVPIVGMAPKWG